jgi:hypothetical protein
MRNKSFRILTQTPEATLRARKARSVGYADTPFQHVPCLFEMEQLERTPLDPRRNPPIDNLGYFGSDRPQRVAEVLRYLCDNESPPSILYGRWSAKSLQQLASRSMRSPTYSGPVPELRVIPWLNNHTSTLYIADRDYVATDFIAQRFFENAVAGVPVIYSDQLQPSIAKVVPADWCVRDARELREAHEAIAALTPKRRAARVRENMLAALSLRLLATGRGMSLHTALQKGLAL